jgi:hypothetical protein
MLVTISALLIATALGVVYYWADFYLRGAVNVVTEDWYIKFERAFPPADLWMSSCAVVGAVGLLKGNNYGLLFALIAAASLIFLALMDITFNIQNSLYRLTPSSTQMKFELFINIWTLGLGIATIVLLSSKIEFI